RYLGQTVTIEAAVDEVLGPSLVQLVRPASFGRGDSLLAYAPGVLGLAVSDRDTVTVTGQVEMFEAARLAEHMEWVEPDAFDRLERRPVFRITSMRTDEGREALIRSGEQEALARADPEREPGA